MYSIVNYTLLGGQCHKIYGNMYAFCPWFTILFNNVIDLTICNLCNLYKFQKF
jgi:hypothetical protein